jgi:hypothetical protein
LFLPPIQLLAPVESQILSMYSADETPQDVLPKKFRTLAIEVEMTDQ